MEKTKILDALKASREGPKRNFNQTFDLVFNFKEMDFKKQENTFEYFLTLPHRLGRKRIVCALVGGESKEESKAADKVILLEDFKRYGDDKKAAKKLAKECDVFIAQANLMAQIAASLGKTLGPRGKMPNPKAGAVVPPKTNIGPLVDKFQKTIKVSVKRPQFQCCVGSTDMKDDEVAENILAVFNSIKVHLPNEEGNIRAVQLKTTMGKSQKVL